MIEKGLWHDIGQHVYWMYSGGCYFTHPRLWRLENWLFGHLWNGHRFKAFRPEDAAAMFSDSNVKPLFPERNVVVDGNSA